MRLSIGLVFIFFSATLAFADSGPRKGASSEMLEQMALHNQHQALLEQNLAPYNIQDRSSAHVRAFHEWDKTGYVTFSEEDRYSSRAIKEAIAKNLPDDVKLIVYTQSRLESTLQKTFNHYAKFMNPKNLIVLRVSHEGRSSLWTRDNTPYPVWVDGEFSLVDAKYYYAFEPDADFQKLYDSALSKTNYYFEGGNFINNSLGDCIVVNRHRKYPYGVSDTAAIPDSVFEQNYGCTNLIRFEHLKGIGHADEVVKFIADDVILTDTEAYVERLEEQGFKVILLPEARTSYATYINSLIVNDTVFVPTFGERADAKALEVYAQSMPNHKIVSIPTARLASRGQGGIHCITMNYPDVPLVDLENALTQF